MSMKQSYWMVLYDMKKPRTAQFAIQRLMNKEEGRMMAANDKFLIGFQHNREWREYRVLEKRMFVIADEQKGTQTLFLICDGERVK